jgi:hypothetical protein
MKPAKEQLFSTPLVCRCPLKAASKDLLAQAELQFKETGQKPTQAPKVVHPTHQKQNYQVSTEYIEYAAGATINHGGYN